MGVARDELRGSRDVAAVEAGRRPSTGRVRAQILGGLAPRSGGAAPAREKTPATVAEPFRSSSPATQRRISRWLELGCPYEAAWRTGLGRRDTSAGRRTRAAGLGPSAEH